MKNQNEIKMHDVPNTPFTIVEQNFECKIVIGNDLASVKKFKNTKDAKRYIYSKPWELIGVLAVKILKSQYEYAQNEIQKEESNTQNNN